MIKRCEFVLDMAFTPNTSQGTEGEGLLQADLQGPMHPIQVGPKPALNSERHPLLS